MVRDRPWLLTRVALDLFVYLSLYGLEIEACRGLHRRKFDGGLGQPADLLLNQNEPPEFATHEVIHVAAASIVQTLLTSYWRPLERVLADVHNGRHIGGEFLPRPPVRLLAELELEVIVAKRTEMRTGKVEDLMPCRGSPAGEQRHLVITVEVDLVVAAVQRHALEKLVGDVRIACRSDKRREPVEARDDAVLDRARFDLTGPANDGWHAEAAFIAGALGRLERGHAAVRPGEHLGTIVRREDDDGVVGFAHVVDVLEQGADAVVQLRHAGFLKAIVRAVVLHRFVFVRQERPDVHTRGVMPDEERLAIA